MMTRWLTAGLAGLADLAALSRSGCDAPVSAAPCSASTSDGVVTYSGQPSNGIKDILVPGMPERDEDGACWYTSRPGNGQERTTVFPEGDRERAGGVHHALRRHPHRDGPGDGAPDD